MTTDAQAAGSTGVETQAPASAATPAASALAPLSGLRLLGDAGAVCEGDVCAVPEPAGDR